MATVVTNAIGSGRTYTSIQAWEDACPANLVTNDQVWKGEIYKEGGGSNNEWVITTGLTIGGSTVDTTRYLWLAAASGASFYDHADKLTNALRYNSANGVAIGTSTAYQHLMTMTSTALKLSGLQLANAVGSARNPINSDGNSLLMLDRCIVSSADPESVVKGGWVEASNSIIYSLSNNAAAHGIQVLNGTQISHIVNCTIHGGGSASAAAIQSPYNVQAVIQNVAAFGFSAFVNDATRFDSASSSNNATNLATGFGSSNQTSLTTADQVQATGAGSEDFRAKSTGSLDGNAVRAQSYTGDIDIVGTARSTTTPTIGAWEVAGAPTAPTAGSATNIAPESVTANWTDNSSNETGFKVEYAPDPYSSWTAASGSPAAANATSLSITGLTAATSYKFRVASTNSGGDSAWSTSAAFTTASWSYARPASDITTGWSASTGTDHYALIDETSASDTDYIYASSASLTDEIKLGPMSAPLAGSDLEVRYRVQGVAAGATVTASLYCGATLIATDTTRTANGDYTLTVPSTSWDTEVADWTDMRIRFVSG